MKQLILGTLFSSVVMTAYSLDVVIDGVTYVPEGSCVATDQPEQDNTPIVDTPTEEQPIVEEDVPDVSGGDVVLGYAITSWPGESQRPITIPKGKVLASKLVTGSGNHGTTSYEASAGSYYATNVWFSKTPGGEPLAQKRCVSEGVSFIYNIRWVEGSNQFRCNLQPNTTYYLNMKHVDPTKPSSVVYRTVK